MFKRLLSLITIAIIAISIFYNISCVSNAYESNNSLYYYNSLENERDIELYNLIEDSLISKNYYGFIWGAYTNEDIKEIFEFVLLDHPEFIIVNRSLKVLTIGSFNRIKFSYNNLDYNLVNEKINNIINEIDDLDINSQLTYIYKSLMDISYKDTEFVDSTAYGTLINGASNCEGYSESFSCILNKLGIENYLVSDIIDGVSHRWNKVCINGEWYEFDATYDATDGNDTWDYFMVKSAH